MAWKKEISVDGMPIWSGVDRIYNLRYSDQKAMNVLAIFFMILGSIMLIISFGLSFDLLSVFMGLGSLAYGFSMRAPSSPKFIGPKWVITSYGDGLAFRGNDEWAVNLDEIARIETGQTCEFTPSRDYRGLVPLPLLSSKEDWQTTPKTEWQTFLFLNDSTRRVIYHANADRDGCAALAHSIRSYLETARGSGPIPAPSGAPVGFDL